MALHASTLSNMVGKPETTTVQDSASVPLHLYLSHTEYFAGMGLSSSVTLSWLALDDVQSFRSSILRLPLQEMVQAATGIQSVRAFRLIYASLMIFGVSALTCL
jgi:hypothetical protein